MLSAAFSSSSVWCSSATALAGCLAPGFAIVFGGKSAISDATIDRLSALMTGSAATSTTDRSPQLNGAFATMLDMSPVFDDAVGATNSARVCVARNDYANSRWLFVRSATSSAHMDVMLRGRYVSDADGVVRSPAFGAPVCVASDSGPQSVRGVSLAGPASPVISLETSTARRVALSGTVSASAPLNSSGLDSTTDPGEGGSTTWTFSTDPVGLTISTPAGTSGVLSATLTLTLARGSNTPGVTAPDRVSGTFSLVTGAGTVDGTIVGEAILVPGVWKIRAQASYTGGSGSVVAGSGGISVDLTAGAAGTLADDSVVWRVDGWAL